MSPVLPSLAGADWLAAPAVRLIFAALDGQGEETRVIGGAVRNVLTGRPVADVDFGTTATPDVVAKRAEAASIKVVPTGISHGTLTLVTHGKGYEVTTLREDIQTDGRHATVRFGRDWAADARRRDFTVNALSVDAGGTVHDPLGGYADVLAHRIRFIGDADRRIAEDRLRILRFFRFHADYGAGPLDPAGLSAAIRARNDLRELSAERIGQEMRRLVIATRAVETVTAMQESGILTVVFGGIGYLAAFARLAAFEAGLGARGPASLRLAVLGCRIAEDAARLTEKLRLANEERDRMLAALAAAPRFAVMPEEAVARRLLYRLGAEAYRDGIAVGLAWGAAPPDDPAGRQLMSLPERWPVPAFPLNGRDILGAGARGAAVGELLRALETWWVEKDFLPDSAALKARLSQTAAAQQ